MKKLMSERIDNLLPLVNSRMAESYLEQKTGHWEKQNCIELGGYHDQDLVSI